MATFEKHDVEIEVAQYEVVKLDPFEVQTHSIICEMVVYDSQIQICHGGN